MTDPIDSARFVPTYTPLERIHVPRPVDRISAIRRICQGKKVLDLGAMDETAFTSKRGQGTWLHEEIAAVAGFLASESGAYITGETLHVNGGMYMS